MALHHIFQYDHVTVFLQDFPPRHHIFNLIDFGKTAQIEIFLHSMTQSCDDAVREIFRQFIKRISQAQIFRKGVWQHFYTDGAPPHRGGDLRCEQFR